MRSRKSGRVRLCRFMSLKSFLSLLTAVTVAYLPGIAAEPHVPVRDNEVLERLPASTSPRARELRELREKLVREPGNFALAHDLARRYIELGRAASDPRYYGYAEAVLGPWTRSGSAVPEALVLRAMVRQNRHAFASALADLDAALAQNPRLAQGWLTRASIQEVRGDYRDALRCCLPLLRLTRPLVAAVCVNSALSLLGQGEVAYQRLRQATERAGGDAGELQWARITLAEMAERLGKPGEAERHYQAALALPMRSPYLLAAYADFLLDQERPGEIVALLKHETRADPLLLRLVLAERRLGRPQFEAHAAALKARFEASRLRGDTTHQGDEARFALSVLEDAKTALGLAARNWSRQREPRDARTLLETALAAGEPAAARPVLDFLRESSLEDVRLWRLVSRFGTRDP